MCKIYVDGFSIQQTHYLNWKNIRRSSTSSIDVFLSFVCMEEYFSIALSQGLILNMLKNLKWYKMFIPEAQ